MHNKIYYSGFSYVFGKYKGSGCLSLNEEKVTVTWIPINKEGDRLMLEVVDKENGLIHGLTKDERIKKYKYEIKNKYSIYWAKAILFIFALWLIFKQRNILLNLIGDRKNGG
jgi:hypothetical protein